MSARALRRCLAAGAAGAVVLLALPSVAGAHVEAEGETVAGVTTVELSFHHGCGTADPTTGLRVQLPEGATEVTATDPTGWTSTVTGTELAWTGGSVPYAEEASFAVSMKLTDPEGTTVFLPTIQECPNGATSAWIDKSTDPEAEHAAPRIIIGAAATTGDDEDVEESSGGHGTDMGTVPEATTNDGVGGAAPTTVTTKAPAESDVASPATQNASDTSSSKAPLIIGIIAAVVVIGIIIGFVVSKRSGTPTSDS